MKALIALLILVLPAAALADRYEFVSDVNLEIPDVDSTGLRDTIQIDQHITIEDVNIFVGIGRTELPVAEHIIVDIYSPSRHGVRLNGWGGGNIIHWYFFWYDTDHPEDGPGQLEDLAGSDAYGLWEMHCFDISEGYPLQWHNWRIEVIGSPMVGISENENSLPEDFEFNGVSPNPFNNTILLSFGLPREADVRFSLYDIQGRKIKDIDFGSLGIGYHDLIWEGVSSSLASGLYFVKMSAGDREITQKAVLLK